MTARATSHAYQALQYIEYRGNPSILVLADAPAVEGWRQAAEQAGCRVIDVVPVAAALGRLDRLVAADAVLLDCGDEAAVGLDALLDRLAGGTESGRFGGIVESSRALVDRVAARAGAAGIEQLCEPSEADRIAAIRLATTPRLPRLNDVNKAQATVRLQQLSEEVGRIANVLAALSEDEAAAAAMAVVGAAPDNDDGERLDAGMIRSIIRARRLRDHFFRAEMFADPAWDMLLDLMAARVEKQRVAVSSLCIAAAVPPTTALRWIKTLCDQGMFVRVADPEDGRRVFIELSPETAAMMEAYLKSAQRIGHVLI
ncbi:MAG TPA: MarR family winged helix-turn-helix transcriptional regulator [Allosphingosinicella sp.]